MNFDQARMNMVEQQIRTWEVLDQGVLDLLYAVPREDFVPPAYRNLAFADLEIPLTAGERMWLPKLEARVLQALAPKRGERVLEIGTGSGYLTALLAQRAAQVDSIEIQPALAALARANLARQGVGNVRLQLGDGACATGGIERYAGFAGPYDIVVLGGSVPLVPAALLASLAPGGRLFAVVGEAPVMAAQLISRGPSGALSTSSLFETLLAPLANCAQPSRFNF